ncbi:MAG: PEGA domain-containing protein [Bacteroidales bacterium]|nr:PEGA domain-containing protein [Bacteroidales bacterium]
MKIVKVVIFLLISIMFFSSCATILSGGKTKIRVYDGTPPNANVYVDGNYVGMAPCKFKIHKTMKNAQHHIDIKATGYKTQTVTTNRKFSAGFFILDICTGVIWTVIDFATGNLYKQKPRKIHYMLMPLNPSETRNIEVTTVNNNNMVNENSIAKDNNSKKLQVSPDSRKIAETPIAVYKSGDDVYCSSMLSFGKCKQGSVKASKLDGSCIILTTDGKEIKRQAKYIYINNNDVESSAIKIGNGVRYGNKIFGYKSGKIVSVPSPKWCIVETEKGDFILKKQSILLLE